jgi:hypothetical protein
MYVNEDRDDVDGLSTNYLFEYCNVTYIQMSRNQTEMK